MRFTYTWILAGLCALSLFGCRPEFEDDQCVIDDDCFPGQMCVDGFCSSEGGGADMGDDDMPPEIAITIGPDGSEVIQGETLQLVATAEDFTGTAVMVTYTWSSSDDTTATVDATGLVTGVTTGPVTITASAEGASATKSLSVRPVPVATVDLTPATASLAVGTSSTLTAVPRDDQGNELTGRTGTWTSSDDALATVDANGEVSAIALGAVAITVDFDGISAISNIEVVPEAVASVVVTPTMATIEVGSTEQLIAMTLNAADVELTGRIVSWVSSDDAIATVDVDGLVTAIAAGTATISAESEGQTGTAAITVANVPVAAVVVSSGDTTIQDNDDTTQFNAATNDAGGTDLARAVVWTTSDATIAEVDAAGLVTGKGVGTATITATSEGVAGTLDVDVIATVVTVQVNPGVVNVIDGATVALAAVAQDGGGATIAGRTPTWSSGDNLIATVDAATGVVTGQGLGTVAIAATIDGIIGTSAVTVVVGPVATVTVTPANATIAPLATQQYVVAFADGQGNAVVDTATWTSSATATATIDAAGIATGVAVGTTTITATADSNGLTGTQVLTVQ